MAVQAGAGGTVLAGDLEVNATISTPAQNWAGSALFIGAGNLAVTFSPVQYAGSALWIGAGNLAANLFKPALQGTAAFAGTGALIASTVQFNAGLYDETGATGSLGISAGAFTELEFGFELNTDTLVNGDILTFRVYRDGVALTTYDVTPTITVSLPLFGTGLFAGSGNLSVDPIIQAAAVLISGVFAGAGSFENTAQLLMTAQATFAGTGAFSAAPQLQMKGSTAAWTAAGSLAADLVKLATNWAGTAEFAGAGQQRTTAVLHLHAGGRPGLPDEVDFSGAGNFVEIAKLLMRSQLPQYSASGAFTAAPQLRMDVGIQFAGSGGMNVDALIKGLITASALFAGSSWLTVAARQQMAEAFAFFGEGQAAIIPRLRMRGAMALAGAGSLVADLRIPEAIYQGSAIYAGAGNLAADAIRFINATAESFAGAGSFDAASALFLPSDAIFGGEGLLSIEAQNQMFAELAFGASGSMLVDIQRYGSDAGRFICDLDAAMTMGDLMAAIATNNLNAETATNSLNTTIRCH